MRIGVPKETKIEEHRVGLTPSSVGELTAAGHEVLVETGAGAAIDFTDQAYKEAGAQLVNVEQAFSTDLVIKVKEPSLAECARLRPGQTLFTYLHLAAAPEQAKALMESGCTAIAYETVEDSNGRLPLLTPMSEVAGRMSIQVGAAALQRSAGGRGVLLGGVPGVAPGKVVILGGGMAGANAAQMACGLLADVTILDKSQDRLRELSGEFKGRARVLMASRENVRNAVMAADLVVGAVLVPGASAPRLIDYDLLRRMQPGSVLVDISIDQGGCFASSKPTTHTDPTYIEEGIVHYCVTNMPGGVARTSAEALNNATLPYIKRLANVGVDKVLLADPGFEKGLNVHAGHVRHTAVAESLGLQIAA